MCQRIGLPPISIMGFGLKTLSSAMRVPRPPARITTFISIFPFYRPFDSAAYNQSLYYTIKNTPFQQIFLFLSKRSPLYSKNTADFFYTNQIKTEIIGSRQITAFIRNLITSTSRQSSPSGSLLTDTLAEFGYVV